MEIFAEVSEILEKGEDLVLVRIVRHRGSTPRAAGARMIVRRSGEILGSIGGGLLEAAAIQKARRVFELSGALVADMDLTGENAPSGMICGGKVTFLCEHVPPDDTAKKVFGGLRSAYQNGRTNILCTEFEDHPKGLRTVRRFLLHHDLHLDPAAPPGVMDQLREAAASLTGSALFQIAGGKYLVELVESAAALFVFGAGHVGREAAVLAARVGFRTVVLDDRPEFADIRRFPTGIEVAALESFERCFEGLAVDENSYIVIVTRGHAHDKTVLAQALKTKAGYVGMMGSKKKRDAVYASLLAEGFSAEDLKRVHCPVGLPLAAETPEEIAVSIVGELIEVRAKKKWRRNP